MRQVPHYLIIGNGRISRHFQHYFSQLKLSYCVWHRSFSPKRLKQALKSATHVLILTSDHAIEDFVKKYLQDSSCLLIHFSGSVITSHAFGAHPLMTFNHDKYDLSLYQSIPFIVDHDAPDFSELLPGLQNPHVRLHTSLKEKYHALCVLSGNFSCLLWQKLFSSFENELQIPADIAQLYLVQQTKNLLSHWPSALTGPLARKDQKTINTNLNALVNDPFYGVYQSFVTCYEKILSEEKYEYI